MLQDIRATSIVISSKSIILPTEDNSPPPHIPGAFRVLESFCNKDLCNDDLISFVTNLLFSSR